MKKNKNNILIASISMSKGEGEWPELSNLTPEEKKDPRLFSKFVLDIDEMISETNPNIIKSCKIIYDGISPDCYNGEYYGLIADEEKGVLGGRVCPIIEFELSISADEIDHDDFKSLVMSSFYVLSPQKQEEPFYSEDWNGYTQVYTTEEFEEYLEDIKDMEIYSGKKFKLSELTAGIMATKLSNRK